MTESSYERQMRCYAIGRLLDEKEMLLLYDAVSLDVCDWKLLELLIASCCCFGNLVSSLRSARSKLSLENCADQHNRQWRQ